MTTTPASPNKSPRAAPRRRLRWLALVFGLTLGSAMAVVQADSYDERRVRTGARVFRTLLASQVNLAEQLPAALPLRIGIYSRDDQSFEQAAASLRPASGGASSQIQKREVEILRLNSASIGEGVAPNGIFIASEPPNGELDALIQWSNGHGVALYSPFDGHVERGVLGGLAVEAKVRIYLNQDALRASGVQLKPLFLKAAKVYP